MWDGGCGIGMWDWGTSHGPLGGPLTTRGRVQATEVESGRADCDCRAGTASVRLMNGGPHERAFSIMSYVSDMARPVLAPSLSFSLSYDDGFGRAFGPERPLAEMGEGEGEG